MLILWSEKVLDLYASITKKYNAGCDFLSNKAQSNVS